MLGITLIVLLVTIGVKNFKCIPTSEVVASGITKERFVYEETNIDNIRLLTDNYTGEQYIITKNYYGWTGITHLEGTVSANE